MMFPLTAEEAKDDKNQQSVVVGDESVLSDDNTTTTAGVSNRSVHPLSITTCCYAERGPCVHLHSFLRVIRMKKVFYISGAVHKGSGAEK